MELPPNFFQFGLSNYDIMAYLSLVGRHPVNGSQLSRLSGIPRARIYDVLRSLKDKGFVVETGDGLYAPLPPEEFFKRLRHGFDSRLKVLEEKITAASEPTMYDYVWTIRGYDKVMDKAKEMIGAARTDIYTRLHPSEGHILAPDLVRASERGVAVKYISMGRPPVIFDLQVIHPKSEKIETFYNGRVFDLVVDKEELLVGLFEMGKEEFSPVNWAKNHWFVITIRDSLRHDFFHFFLYKILEKKQHLSNNEKALYKLISRDL